MGFIRNVLALLAVNLRSIPQRWGSSLVIVVGLAGVVAVITALQSMSVGMMATLKATGAPDRAIVIRDGSLTELSSFITREEFTVIEQHPALAQNADGKPLASGELLVITEQQLKARDSASNVSMRGVSARGFDLRPEITLIEGRQFEPGLQELIVGSKARDQFANLEIGNEVKLRGSFWTVVGIFESGGDARESEIWADLETAQSAFNRNAFSTVLVKLQQPEQFDQFRDELVADPRLTADVKTEEDFFSAQSNQFRQSIGILVGVVGVIMGLGAIFAALNTMYSAISTRATEIATLRAIGFTGGVVVWSTLIEAVVLAAAGGLIGGLLAYVIFNGYTVSTLGAGFTQVAFEFKVTADLLVSGLLMSLIIGVIGGLFPALRAAQAPIAEALRSE